MWIERAYKYRWYPTPELKELIDKTCGCCRYVFNHFLFLKKEKWEKEKKALKYNECAALLVQLKSELVWLKEVSSVALQQSLRNLEKAFTNFFQKRTKYPRFKKKQDAQKATFMKNSFCYRDGEIYLAKHKMPLNIRWSRRFHGEPTSITITKEASGRYYISILVKEEIQAKTFVPKAVGIDLGLSSFSTDHEGNTIPPSKFLRRQLDSLRKKSRALSKKIKGSNNRNKARKKLAILHSHIRNQREDFTHKLSSKLVNENQVIAVEDLCVKKLQQEEYSASVSDVGWSKFVNYLKYKCSWYGKEFVQVDRYFPSSKKCSCCDHVLESLSIEVRKWQCPACNASHKRDTNAARNILAEAVKLLLERYRGTHGTLSLWSLCKTIQETLKGDGLRSRNLACEG